MYKAVKEIERLQGGITVVENGKLIDCLPLEIAGLMSKDSIPAVAKRLKKMKEKVYSMGVTRQSPFMTLSFMALPVIPSLKITDQGLFDIDENRFVSLGVDK
jgi:adenine deaminase